MKHLTLQVPPTLELQECDTKSGFIWVLGTQTQYSWSVAETWPTELSLRSMCSFPDPKLPFWVALHCHFRLGVMDDDFSSLQSEDVFYWHIVIVHNTATLWILGSFILFLWGMSLEFLMGIMVFMGLFWHYSNFSIFNFVDPWAQSIFIFFLCFKKIHCRNRLFSWLSLFQGIFWSYIWCV